ncbi:hypothetical protein CR969_03105 [Candidatus Saccharibacteria bacterium]|nr:MAG: hypothetical protein CR969_03105 [Candidatus Saccharibacteria bacterium]
MAQKKATKTTKKKPTTKAKSTSPRKTKAKKPAKMESFKSSKEHHPFMTFKFTRQTVYWLIIAVVILGLSAWIFKLQSDIFAIYDKIDDIHHIEK